MLPAGCGFSLSAKDTFQRPPATRWTGIFQNFFRFCNARKGILATGGQRIFPFTPYNTAFLNLPNGTGNFFLLSTTDKNPKCQTPGQKNSPLTYYYNLNWAKWPGTEPDNKKSSKSFSDLLLSLAAGGRLVFSFDRFFSGSYTAEGRGFPVHQGLSSCKHESPCVRKIP